MVDFFYKVVCCDLRINWICKLVYKYCEFCGLIVVGCKNCGMCKGYGYNKVIGSFCCGLWKRCNMLFFC